VPARPGPRLRARADRDARRRDPARRHPRRFRLRHRDASAWAIPLRAAGAQLVQDLHPARPRPQGHPPRRDHRQREPVLPARHPRRCWNSGRSPAPPPPSRPRPRPQDQPSSPATSSAASPQTTPTATTGSVPAVIGKIRCPLGPHR
jgi:hypothetical protein